MNHQTNSTQNGHALNEKNILKSHDINTILFEKKQYPCSECGKSYKQLSSLQRHTKKTHLNDTKRHKCTYCPSSFHSKYQLTVHNRTHTNERPYSCNRCPKKFRQNSHLLTHMRTHTKEKPYQCKECGKRFTQSSSVTTHMRIHRNIKPFACPHCLKSFTQKHSRDRHILAKKGKCKTKPKEIKKDYLEVQNLKSESKQFSFAAFPNFINSEPMKPMKQIKQIKQNNKVKCDTDINSIFECEYIHIPSLIESGLEEFEENPHTQFWHNMTEKQWGAFMQKILNPTNDNGTNKENMDPLWSVTRCPSVSMSDTTYESENKWISTINVIQPSTYTQPLPPLEMDNSNEYQPLPRNVITQIPNAISKRELIEIDNNTNECECECDNNNVMIKRESDNIPLLFLCANETNNDCNNNALDWMNPFAVTSNRILTETMPQIVIHSLSPFSLLCNNFVDNFDNCFDRSLVNNDVEMNIDMNIDKN